MPPHLRKAKALYWSARCSLSPLFLSTPSARITSSEVKSKWVKAITDNAFIEKRTDVVCEGISRRPSLGRRIGRLSGIWIASVASLAVGALLLPLVVAAAGLESE